MLVCINIFYIEDNVTPSCIYSQKRLGIILNLTITKSAKCRRTFFSQRAWKSNYILIPAVGSISANIRANCQGIVLWRRASCKLTLFGNKFTRSCITIHSYRRTECIL